MKRKRTPDLVHSDDDISLFISRFTTGHWAMQGEVNMEKCTTQYIPPNEKCHLTPKLVKRHLDTEITLASYTITRENTCRFLVIDFDIDTLTAKAAIGAPGSAAAKKARKEALKKIQEEVSETIMKMGEKLRINRDQILIERSGVKGYHLWLFFEEEVPSVDTYKMTRILSNELDLAGYEIYPMQPAGDDTKPGSLIKLPLGVNRKNWERCLILDDNFEPVAEGQWNALRDVVPISTTHMTNILKLQDTEVDRVEDDDMDDISQIGGSIDRMISKCQALQIIADRSENANPDDGEVNLSHDERLCILSLFKKFGVVGASRIHEFLQNADNYDMDKTNNIIANSGAIKPMCCETMIQRGICQGECENIRNCGGRSPIKLALSSSRQGKAGTYILNTLAEIENPVICHKNIRVDFTTCSLIDSPYYSSKRVVFKPCDNTTCPDYEEKCICADRDEKKIVIVGVDSKTHIQVYGVDDKKSISFAKCQVEGCSKPDRLRLHGTPEKYVVQPFTCSNIVYSLSEEMFKTKTPEEEEEEGKTVAAKEMKDYLAFFLGSSLETSKTYRGYGTVLPNPHNQSITILFNKVEPLNSQIDDFEINESNEDLFEQFKSMTIEEKINDIRDNVALIYGRDEVIMSILLTHFSALEFSFNNAPISKGWMETILIGDSGQAKSVLTLRLLDYIGLGKINSSNSSAAGLIGGVERAQNKSYINWGAIPRANKSLIFLDEVQNLNWETVSQLRTIRQHGYADVNKIVKGKHEAKVRLICAANPMPKDKTLAEFKYGAEALATVFGTPDIRRFDLACFLNEGDTDKAYVNKLNDSVDPIVTREMIRTALMWVWSRKPHQIQISMDVTKTILKGAVYLSDKFDVGSVPLCNAADMREKLARMVVAVAGFRLATPDRENLIPEVSDVDFVVKMLDDMYSHKSVGLDMLNIEKRKEANVDELQYQELKQYIHSDGYSKMRKIINGLIDMDGIRASDLAGWARASSDEMSKIIAVLNKYQMIKLGQFGQYSAKPKLLKFERMLREEEREEDTGGGYDTVF